MLYVVTAIHNRKEITEKFVSRLLKQNEIIHLVVVDDGSTDHTADMIRTYLPDSTIIRGNGNLWWGGSMKVAHKWISSHACEGDIIWVVNDDTDFPDDYCKSAMAVMESYNNIILTGYAVEELNSWQIDGSIIFDEVNFTFALNKGSGKYGNCASTRSLFIRAKDYIHGTAWYPFLLPHYGSDYAWTIDLCRKQNLSVYCTDKVKYVANQNTTGYHGHKNRTVRQILSKRSDVNPFYKITFAVIISPNRYKLKAFRKQLGSIFRSIRDYLK